MSSNGRQVCPRCGASFSAGVCPLCGYDPSAHAAADHVAEAQTDDAADNQLRAATGREVPPGGPIWNRPILLESQAETELPTVCSQCRADNPPGSVHCGDCGSLLQRACLRCGSLNPARSRYCHQCGAPRSDLTVRRGTAERLRSVRLPRTYWMTGVTRAGLDKAASAKATFFGVRQALDFSISDGELPSTPRVRLLFEIAVVLALVLIGLLIRVWNIGSVPGGPAGDEASFALEVLRVLTDGWIGIWTPSILGSPAGYIYSTVPFFWLGGPTLAMLRLPAAIFGVLLIPASYFMLRMLFPFRVAALSAGMLVFFFWFLVASRLAFPMIMSAGMTVASLCLIVYAFRSGRLWVAILAGLTLGLGLYTFKGYLIYFAPIWGLSLLVLIASNKLRRQWSLYLIPVISLIVGAAMLEFYATTNYISSNLQGYYEVDISSIFSLSSLQSYTVRVFDLISYIHITPDKGTPGFDGIILRPLVHPLIGIFFWLGLLISLLFINRRPYQMLLVGWLVAMAPAVLVPGGEPRRYLLGAFFVLFIIAIGYVAALHLVISRWLLPRLSILTALAMVDRRILASALAGVGMVGFVALFAALNLAQFREWPTTPAARFQFTVDLGPTVEFMRTLDESHQVRFYSPRWSINNEIIQWLAPDSTGTDGSVEFGGDGTIFSDGVVSQPTVFVLLGGYLHLIDDLKKTYSSGVEYHGDEHDGRPLFIAYSIDNPPPPGTVQMPAYYRLEPDPEQARFRMGVPLTFFLGTNQSHPVQVVFNPSTAGKSNFTYQNADCPLAAGSSLTLGHGESVHIHACEPGESHIELYIDDRQTPVQSYQLKAVADAATATEDSGFSISPDPSDLDIRAEPTRHHPLHLHSTQSALLTVRPAEVAVIHNSVDLPGMNGCEEGSRTPDGDTRVSVILPEPGEEIRSPIWLVGCTPGQAALEILKDGEVQETYLLTVGAP